MKTDGIDFEGHKVGDVYRTLARTVSETDIVNFVNACGFTEPLFLDMEFVKRESVFGRRAAPGALTFALSEGLVMQTGLIHGTGMAFAGLDSMRLFGPVKVNDTIQVEIEVLDTKPVRARGGGIVRYRQWVKNQRGETIMEYDVARLIRGAATEQVTSKK
jgi:acyl dehydratase